VNATAEAAIAFWKELTQKTIDSRILQQKGFEISLNFEKISSLVVKLIEIYPNEVKFFVGYGTFLKEIINNDIDAQIYLEKAFNIYNNRLSKKVLPNNEQNIFGENSLVSIIIIDANSKNIGNIVHANEESIQMFHYKREELLDTNISQHMPKPIGKVHNRFIERYFDTARPKVIDIKRELFAVNKEGYMFPIVLLVKVYPSLMKKLLFVGFLQKIDRFRDMEDISRKETLDLAEQHYILTDREGYICNITEGLRHEIGLHAKFFNPSDSILSS